MVTDPERRTNIFCCRAECQLDVALLMIELAKIDPDATERSFKLNPPLDLLPDRSVEIQTTASLDDVLNAARAVRDAQVIVQTLRAPSGE